RALRAPAPPGGIGADHRPGGRQPRAHAGARHGQAPRFATAAAGHCRGSGARAAAPAAHLDDRRSAPRGVRRVSEYARAGLVGILPPQSNTTVEAELGVLLAPNVGTIVSRLVCHDDDSRTRLVGYWLNVEQSLRAFDTAKPDVVLFACTGSTYLVGLEEERKLFSGRSILSAAQAVLA